MPLDLPYDPDDAYEVSHKPRIRKVQFGDGEEQRSPQGLNHDLATWNVSFVEKPKVTAMMIFEFLKSHKGYVPFYFRPADAAPLDPPKLVVCEDYSKRYVHHDAVMTVTGTFREVVR